MMELFQAYLQNSISLSIIGILILVLMPLLSRRYSAKCIYSLWFIVFFALLLPIHSHIYIHVPGTIKPLMSNGYENSIPISMTKITDLWQIALILWAGGVFCSLLWYTLHHLRFMCIIRRWSEEIQQNKKEQLYRIKAEMGIKHRIDIRSCACIRTPMMIGFFNPVILFPEIDLSMDEFSAILKHELVHYKRKDLYFKMIVMLALIIHWFNPFVHIMARSVLSLCEISCDEEVLKGADSKTRLHYGETIINVIREGKFYYTVLSTNFNSSAKGMKKRIYAIMNMKRKRFSFLALLVVTIITFFGVNVFVLTAQPEKNYLNKRVTISTDSIPSTVTDYSKNDSTLIDSNPHHIPILHKHTVNEIKLIPIPHSY